MEVLDIAKSREVKKLIESLTHSGSKDLNLEELANLVEMCNEKIYLTEAQSEIWNALQKRHSEVRYSAVQLCHQFFMKFQDFRNHILQILDEYFALTLGIQTKDPLPPPKAAERGLKRITLEYLLTWQKTFPIPKLIRACRYLEDVENTVLRTSDSHICPAPIDTKIYFRPETGVDFKVLDIVDPKERKEREESEARMMKLNKERLKKINNEMEDLLPEIRSTLAALESCFTLLMPPPDEDMEEPAQKAVEDMRLFGVVSCKQTVQIELDDKIVIKVDEENSAIIEAAKDSFTLIYNRYLPKVKAWVETINKAEGEAYIMREALVIKRQLESAVSKYGRLDIRKCEKHNENEEDLVSTDSELEEVEELKPAKSKTAEEIDFLSPTLGLKKKEKKKELTDSKTSDAPINSNPVAGPSTSEMNERKKQLLEVAPKLPFDIDLYHWEDEKLSAPTLVAVNSEGSRFWGGAASEELTEITVPDGAALLRTRVIEYTGKWEPIEHTCKAPLPSGKLCPRKDRVKCPHHGLIVERDEKGQIINEEDVDKVAKSKRKPEVPEWQDPKLLAEIKAQTGVDLKMPEKGKRAKKKKKYPGLTDINESKNTPAHRISKKIFDKKSLKRVAQTLDKIDHKKHRDKFGDQFNYVHGT